MGEMYNNTRETKRNKRLDTPCRYDWFVSNRKSYWYGPMDAVTDCSSRMIDDNV